MPAAAYADGIFGGCRENEQEDGMALGCQQNADGTSSCNCDTNANAAQIGSGLLLLGVIAYSVGRKRRPR